MSGFEDLIEAGNDGVVIGSVWSEEHQGYVVALHVQGHTVVLEPVAAQQWAYDVCRVGTTARHDAAFVKMLRSGTDPTPSDVLAQMLSAKRRDQGEFTARLPGGPMSLTPGVNRDGEPFVTIHMDEYPIGQWTVDDVDQHAAAVLSSIAAAVLDEQLFVSLQASGMSPDEARTLIAHMGHVS